MPSSGKKTSKKTRAVTPATADADAAFAAIVDAWRSEPGIDLPDPTQRAFGSNALKAGGKIFAMLVRGDLVVKLPKARVDALVGQGEARRFEPRPGKAMSEWLSVSGAEDTWAALAGEAHAFVTRTSRTRAAARAPRPRSRS